MNDTRRIPFNEHPSKTALAAGLARDVAAALVAAVASRGAASLVVSGGSTPKPMFDALAQHDEVDWPRVSITLADERAVPPEHVSSNERLLRAHLLQGAAASATFIALCEAGITADGTAEAALARVSSRLAVLQRPFDVVLLGMGDDGHTASLFPDAPELEAAMDRDVGRDVMVMHPPSQPTPRITMTRAALLDTRRLWLYITGDDKRAVYGRVMQEGTLPIARVLGSARDDCETAAYWAA